MNKIEIFDPAMCCETGVCGAGVDAELIRVATTINILKVRGINIIRYGLTNNPDKFILNDVISNLLNKEGAEILPVTLLNGEVAKTKAYPTNEELENWLDVKLNMNKNNESGCNCKNGCCS